MAYEKVSVQDAPRRSRLSKSRFENTPEWLRMSADIDAGIKPDDVLKVCLTEADKKKYNLKHRRTVARFIQKYLRSRNLPYTVKSFHRDDEGDFFLVQYDGLTGTHGAERRKKSQNRGDVV